MTEDPSTAGQATRKLADQLNQFAGANEANVLLLTAAVNMLFRLAVKSRLSDARTLQNELDHMADSITSLPRLRDNESVLRRMPLLKKMLLDGTQEAGGPTHE